MTEEEKLSLTLNMGCKGIIHVGNTPPSGFYVRFSITKKANPAFLML